MNEPILWYFADPMCSWCWGFSPVIEAIKQTNQDRLKVALVLGGLRPGTVDPITPQGREEILHHWHDVQQKTGQTFTFEGAMPDGFIYDTEPPSRGVIAASEISPEATFPFFKAVQSAFYMDQKDVTKPAVLAELATKVGLDSAHFLELFNADDTKKKVLAHFQMARQWGIRGFPTVVLQNAEKYHLLTNGYCELDVLQPQIDELLG